MDKNSKNPVYVDKVHSPISKKPASLTEYTFDQIEHLADIAKRASLSGQPNAISRIDDMADVAISHIDDMADLATGLAMDLLDAQVEIERIKKQYEADHTRVEETVLALRTSRTKLEAERDHVQDLGARINGIKFDHMTALAKYQVQKAEYEYRVKESEQLQRTYKRAVAELEATKDEREKELVMMATQMWNLKLMVGDMFARSEWALKDGMLKAGEEIDFTLQRLENVMNASIRSGDWGKMAQDTNVESVPVDTTFGSWVLVTKDAQDPANKLQGDPERMAWKDMERYMAERGSCAIDNEEDGPEVMVLRAKELKTVEEAYWHEGEYRFWDY